MALIQQGWTNKPAGFGSLSEISKIIEGNEWRDNSRNKDKP